MAARRCLFKLEDCLGCSKHDPHSERGRDLKDKSATADETKRESNPSSSSSLSTSATIVFASVVAYLE